MKKVRIKAQAILDLTNYDAKALSGIKSITSVALILLPKNEPEGFTQAYSKIKKSAVAAEIKVDGDVSIFDGKSIITGKELRANSTIIIDGIGILKDIPKEMNISVISGGILVIASSANVNIIMADGMVEHIDLPDDLPVIFQLNKITVNADTVLHLENNSIILCCNKIFIEKDVTSEMLSEKNIKMICLNKIIAEKKLHGYLNVNAKVINKIVTPQEEEQHEIMLYGKKKLRPWKK